MGLDDDDEFTSDRVSYLVSHYNDKYSLITSNTLMICSNHTRALFNQKRETIVTFEDLLWENVIGTQVLVRKDRIMDCGGFDTSLSSGQDVDMWLNLLKNHGSALRLPKCTYKLHTEHENHRISTSSKKLEGWLGVFEKYKKYRTTSQLKYADLKIKCNSNRSVFIWKLLSCFDLQIYLFLIKRIFKFV